MKLSKSTIAVLKNFANINTNLYIDEGSVIRTVSSTKTVLATAKINDEFPKSFGILDLSKFLSAIALFNDPELDFSSSNYVTIESPTGSKLRFVFADKEALIVPTTSLTLGDKLVQVKVSKETLEEVLKAAGAISATTISFISRDGSIKLVARSVDPNMSEEEALYKNGDYSVSLGECSHTFSVDFQLENLKLFPASYEVSLDFGKKVKALWQSESEGLEYWTAAATTSTSLS